MIRKALLTTLLMATVCLASGITYNALPSSPGAGEIFASGEIQPGKLDVPGQVFLYASPVMGDAGQGGWVECTTQEVAGQIKWSGTINSNLASGTEYKVIAVLRYKTTGTPGNKAAYTKAVPVKVK